MPSSNSTTNESPSASRAKRARHVVLVGVKRFLMFLFSQVGLTSAVVAYSILGGVIFQGLEAPYERDQRLKVEISRELYTKQIVELSMELTNTSESYDKWKMAVMEAIDGFQSEVYHLISEYGWDGQEPEEELQWSFAGALLYSVTVITTIGYGHIAPKTSWGRIVTIVYAIVGIPIFFLCLRNIGSLLSVCVKLVYKHACIGLMRRWIFIKKRMRRSRKIARLREAAVRARKWSRQIQRGSLEKGGEEIEYPTVELPGLRDDSEDRMLRGSVEDRDSDEDLFAEEIHFRTDTSEVRVPVSLTLFLMTGYIIGGAVMFALWEKDWNYLIASYFCFITLSTIGFGDYVPGTNIDSWASTEKRVICCLYLLFGMAMQAMCFHLMQEEVRYKFRNLGRKIGLLENEEQTHEEDT